MAPDPSPGVPRDGGSGGSGWLPSDWGMFMAAPGTKARDRLGCGHSVKQKKVNMKRGPYSPAAPHKPELSPAGVTKGREECKLRQDWPGERRHLKSKTGLVRRKEASETRAQGPDGS